MITDSLGKKMCKVKAIYLIKCEQQTHLHVEYVLRLVQWYPLCQENEDMILHFTAYGSVLCSSACLEELCWRLLSFYYVL